MTYDPRKHLDEDELAFIEWRVNPEREGTQDAWLASRGLGKNTIARWRMSPAFMSVYETELRKYGVTYERIAFTLNKLYANGQKGDTQALVKYLEWSQKMLPSESEDLAPSEMTDEQLAQALRDAADRVQPRG